MVHATYKNRIPYWIDAEIDWPSAVPEYQEAIISFFPRLPASVVIEPDSTPKRMGERFTRRGVFRASLA